MSVESFERRQFSRIPEQHLKTAYKNPALDLPFEAKEVAVYLRHEGEVPLRALDYHHRSADLGLSGPIEDKQHHHVYFQCDVKGVGFIFPETYESKKHAVPAGHYRDVEGPQLQIDSKETPWEYDVYGLMDKRMAKDAIETSAALAELGVRTEAVAEVFETDAIYQAGKLIGLPELKEQLEQGWQRKIDEAATPEQKDRYRRQRRNFREQFTPVILIRLMRSVFRMRDALDEPARRQAMLEEACENLNTEAEMLGWTERFDAQTPEGRAHWLEFMAASLGRNLGLMHGRNFVHGYLHLGNLTLAGEIVDLDSVTPLMQEKKGQPATLHPKTFGYQRLDPESGLPMILIKDMRDLCFSLRQIVRSEVVGGKADRLRVAEKMMAAYTEALGDGEPYAAIGLTREQLRRAFEKMATDLVGRGKHVSPIPADETE